MRPSSITLERYLARGARGKWQGPVGGGRRKKDEGEEEKMRETKTKKKEGGNKERSARGHNVDHDVV